MRRLSCEHGPIKGCEAPHGLSWRSATSLPQAFASTSLCTGNKRKDELHQCQRLKQPKYKMLLLELNKANTTTITN